jgi:pimeloyl-ACP methyl ester carboxylesterase
MITSMYGLSSHSATRASRCGAPMLSPRMADCVRMVCTRHRCQLAPVAAAAGVIALSPPRLAYAVQAESAHGPRFQEALARARRLVDAGRPDELLPTEVPIPAYFAAAQFLKKYGPEDRYDLVRHLPRVACPVLLVLGTREAADSAAIGGTAAAALAGALPHLRVVSIDGADHVYTGVLESVLDAVVEWLRAPVPAVT